MVNCLSSSLDVQLFLSVALAPNPFKWPGPEFLILLSVLYVIALTFGVVLRIRIHARFRNIDVDKLDLSIAQLAYLNGGQRQMALATIARMLHEGSLDIQPKATKFRKPLNPKLYAREPLHIDSDDVSQLIYREASGSDGLRVDKLNNTLASLGTRIKQSLEDQELQCPHTFQFLPALPMLGVVVIAVTKLLSVFHKAVPIDYLILSIAVAGVTFIILSRRPSLTPAGKRLVKKNKQEFAHLYLQPRMNDFKDLDSANIAMSVALFGLAVSTTSPLYALQYSLPPTNTSTGCGTSCGGSSCGGSGCGGGGCGGGCGGCGS